MPKLADYSFRIASVAPDATVGEVRALLETTFGAPAVPIVEAGRPVGLIPRHVALSAELDATAASVMSGDPPLVSGGASPLEAIALLARTTNRSSDCVLVFEGDRVIGTASLATLAEGLRAGQVDALNAIDAVTTLMNPPVDAILAMTALLERQPLAPDAVAHVQSIRDAGAALRRVLAQLAELRLAARGGLALNEGPVVLRGVIDAVQAQWHGRAGATPLLMAYDGDPDLCAIADRDRLCQIFDCLIEPALAVTTTGSVEASLKAVRGPEGVRVEGRVRDSGPGLEPAALAHVFDAGRPHGAGPGVPLARELVQAIGGCIRAESNVGAGLTIVFDVLCAPADAPAQVRQTPAPATAAHILIVDDNATNRMVAEALVEMFDCTSECAEDGVQAVEAARRGRFDLILMDIRMPNMDGVTATRAIRDLPGPAGETPILALTANADPEDARQYLAAGMCGVIEKPIKPERLLQAINAALAADILRRSAA